MLFKEDFIKMKIGTEIWVNNIARSGHYQEEKNKYTITYKKIFKDNLSAKKHGYFIGYRYLYEGSVERWMDVRALKIKNSVFVILVVFDSRQNPKYVFPEDCSLI